MLRVLYCIQNDHDLRLITLAGLICATASMATIILLRHARDTSHPYRSSWLCAAGLASGFGIWSTHFIAMLGYDPGIVSGYALVPTALSLIVAIASTTFGFWLALRSRGASLRYAAGAVFGIGVAAMHYTGMQAVELAGDLHWSLPYVVASIIAAMVPIIPAMTLALDRSDPWSALGASVLVVLAILLLHFVGMAAITMIPGQARPDPDMLLSPFSMSIAVAGAALAVLVLGMLSALLSGRARAVIAANEREFRMLVQGISDCAIYMLDRDGRIASWNAGAHRLKGYDADEVIGRDLATFYSAEDRAAGIPAQLLEQARLEGQSKGEGWRYRKNGTRFWAHVTIERAHDDRGAFLGFAKITRDMTRFKEDQDALQAMAGKLDAALSNMHQGLCLFGADGRLVIANDRVGILFGLRREDSLPGMAFEEFVRLALERAEGRPVSEEQLLERLQHHRACLGNPEGGSIILPIAGHRTMSISHQPMAGGGWVTTFDDITERRRVEQRIEHMALHDDLTGLPNRANYTQRLRSEIEHADALDLKVAVIGIDLNRFKEINDAHGHAMGDAVLKQLAQRMSATLDGDEFVARFGGDEFAAVKTFHTDDELTDFVARLDACLTATVEIDRLALYPSASFGIAVYPDDGFSCEQVVNNADLAMYRAKATVGRQICYYQQGMDEAARERRRLAKDLRDVATRGEMSLVYQEQRSVTRCEVTAYEALLRWRHPRLGMISPVDFVPIAEESGEIVRIGEWVLNEACREAARWPGHLRVAVNISPVQLMHIELVDAVRNALNAAGLPADRLELEITETAFVADKVRALHVLRQIKALGVTVAIDDFGVGYSSLDTLNSFPFDKIKIDRSFVRDSSSSHQARAIIRAVLALGHSLGVPVLAEGLESEEQLQFLRSEGCDEAQGFYWGMPHAYPQVSPHGGHHRVGNAA